MRVTIFGAGHSMTGANLLMCRWAEHLRGQGHDVSMLPAEEGAGPLSARYAAAGVRMLTQEQVFIDGKTLVLCNTILAAELLIKCASFSRCIWWLHEGEIGAEILGRLPSMRQAFVCAKAVIFPAGYMLDSIYHGFVFDQPRRKLFVVPNGVDAAEESADRPSQDGSIRVVSVGTLYARKRQEDLVRAVAARPDLPLVCQFVGRALSLDEEAQAIIRAHPQRFQLMGELPHAETLAVIEAADIVAHPSGDEAAPLVPLEAGMRGKPLVLASLPIYGDVWRHGENCLMHPAGDVALLAHMLAILAADGDLRRRLGAAARKTAQTFRTEAMLAQLDQIVAQVARENALPR